MKAELVKEKPLYPFVPFEMTITFENENDATFFYEIMKHSPIKNTDPIFFVLEKELQEQGLIPINLKNDD